MTSFTVHCTHCDTAFPVDPEKVPDGGVRARCTNCEGIFFVATPTPVAPPALSEEPDVVAPAQAEVVAEPEIEHQPESAPAATDAHDAPAAPALPEPDDAGFGSFDDEIEGVDPAPILDEIDAPRSDAIDAPVSDVMDALTDEMGADETPGAVPVVDHEVPDTILDPTPVIDEVPPDAGPPALDEAPPELEEAPAVLEDALPEVEVQEVPPEVEDVPLVVEETPLEVQQAPPVPHAADPEVEHEAPAVPTGFQFGKRDPHEKARRLARVLVSDMITYNAERHAQAVARGTLAEDFEDEIGKSWQEYVDQVGAELAGSTPYWTDALNAVLANGNEMF